MKLPLHLASFILPALLAFSNIVVIFLTGCLGLLRRAHAAASLTCSGKSLPYGSLLAGTRCAGLGVFAMLLQGDLAEVPVSVFGGYVIALVV